MPRITSLLDRSLLPATTDRWSLVPMTDEPQGAPAADGLQLVYRIVKDGKPLDVCLLLDIRANGQFRSFLAPLFAGVPGPDTPLIGFGFPPMRLHDFDRHAARRLLACLFAALGRCEYWAMLS